MSDPRATGIGRWSILYGIFFMLPGLGVKRPEKEDSVTYNYSDTVPELILGGLYAEPQTPYRQAGRLAATRRIESASAGRAGPALSTLRVLRCQGLGPGQVR